MSHKLHLPNIQTDKLLEENADVEKFIKPIFTLRNIFNSSIRIKSQKEAFLSLKLWKKLNM
jgi:hypothetical protein